MFLKNKRAPIIVALATIILGALPCLAQAASMQQVWKIQLPQGQIVTAMAFSPHGNRLIIGKNDGGMLIYGTTTDKHADWGAKPLFDGMVMSGNAVTALAFDPAQKLLAIGASDGTVNFSNNAGVVLKSFKFAAAVKQITFSSSGSRAMILCDSSTVQIINIADYSLQTYNYKFFRPVAACFGASDNEIVEGLSNANGELVKGNINMNRATLKTYAERFGVAAMALNASGNMIAVSGKDRSGMDFYALDSLLLTGGVASLDVIEQIIFGAGDGVIGRCADGSIKVFSTIDGSEKAAEYYGQTALTMAAKPDFAYLAAAYSNGDICIFTY